jgi:hypothetical protein
MEGMSTAVSFVILCYEVLRAQCVVSTRHTFNDWEWSLTEVKVVMIVVLGWFEPRGFRHVICCGNGVFFLIETPIREVTHILVKHTNSLVAWLCCVGILWDPSWNMARFATLKWLRTQMLRLERVQCRGIRIALGLMCSTPNNSLCQGIAPLAERFVYLKIRYLEAVFYCLDHPLKRRLETLRELNFGRCISGYSDVMSLDILSSWSFTRHDLPALLAIHFVRVITWRGYFSGFRHLCIRWWLTRAVDGDSLVLHRCFYIRMALW